MNFDFTALFIVLVMALVTMLTRFLPFFLFGGGGELPKWVRFLGKFLPPAVMSVLLVFCIRSVDFIGGSYGIPELLCIGVAIGLHAWKRNTLLSIGVSTVLYMLLVQLVFV